MKKNLIRLVLAGFIIIALVLGGFAYYLETSIDSVMTKENQDSIINHINNSEELPESFYNTYNKYFPKAFETSLWKSLINKHILGRRMHETCKCRDLYIHPTFKNYSRFAHFILVFELEEKCGQKKCFEAMMHYGNFGPKIRAKNNESKVRVAAREFFNKELEELNEREIIGLSIVIPKGSTRYNPIRNTKNYNMAIDAILEKHEK